MRRGLFAEVSSDLKEMNSLDGGPLQKQIYKTPKTKDPNGEKMLCFYGRAVSDAVILPCKEERICQQKKGRKTFQANKN